MKIAVIGARGLVGRACTKEIAIQNHESIALSRDDDIPPHIQGVIIAATIDEQEFDVTVIDCSGSLQNSTLVIPNITEVNTVRMRIPNCMASLIAQALAPLHEHCTITSIIATCMQSASGAGWGGVQALKQNDTEELFGGILVNNVLPHEKAEQEEQAIRNDLQELFGCEVTATSFRVPVFVGHTASLQIETMNPIDASLLPESPSFDPRSMENKRKVAIGRARIQKNTANLVVCGDQLLCGTAIPAVASIVGT
jgi:aspartate-semialdehyde dehydrogenase|tara:strand:- start:832 stop:1593 length:762 start_codon:yes stop_codon:yes gene_type:complete